MEKEIRRSGTLRRKKQEDVENDKRNSKDRRAAFKDSEQIIDYMKRIPIFDGLTNEQYTEILNLCSKKVIPADHYLCRDGDKSNDLYILLKGQLKVMSRNGALLAFIDTLGLVGEMGVFTDTPRSASVAATDNCIVIRINKDELFELFNNNCPLGNRIFLNVIKDLANKLQEDNEVIDELRRRRNSLF